MSVIRNMSSIETCSIGQCKFTNLIDRYKFANQRAVNSSKITRIIKIYSNIILNMYNISDMSNTDNTNSLDAHTWSEDKLSEVTLYTDKSRNWSNSYFKDVKFHR